MADKKVTIAHKEVDTVVRALRQYVSDRCRLIESFDRSDPLHKDAQVDLKNLERVLARLQSPDSNA
jgi:hypothetical protein